MIIYKLMPKNKFEDGKLTSSRSRPESREEIEELFDEFL